MGKTGRRELDRRKRQLNKKESRALALAAKAALHAGDRLYFSGCYGKRRYTSTEQAKKVARKLNIKYYLCKYCTNYHVGHSSAR